MSLLYVAITSHGFGHCVRASSVIAAAQALDPELLPVFVTTAPHWLIESYLPGRFIHRPRAYDVGVIQADSLQMDREATRARNAEIRAKQNAIIAGEVDFIRTNQIRLVLADIPPLATAIAATAGVPCWMMGNFGWDFIYRDWGEELAELADWISQQYSKCDRLYRLPMHEPMSAFPNITDVGITAATPRYSVEEIRDRYGITAPKEQTALLSFGGLGLQKIPYANLSHFPDWQFITFDRDAPELPNLIRANGDRRDRPLDLMPGCGRIISKPGYSTFAEAMGVGVPIVSLTREGFAESPLLLASLQNYAHHQIVEQADFFKGNWEFLRQDVQPPRRQEAIATGGAETIAQAIVDYLHSQL